MEDADFEGLAELFSGTENVEFESIFRETNPDKNKAALSDLWEDLSNDETDGQVVDPLLDEDLDEVMRSFQKELQESQQKSEEKIPQQDDVALTAEALLDLEQTLVVHDGDDEKKGVHHDDNSRRGKDSVADDDGVLEAVPEGFISSGDDASWRNPSVGSGNVNHPRSDYIALNNHLYHNSSEHHSWNARNANLVSGRFTDQAHIRPAPWSNPTTPRWVHAESAPIQPVPSIVVDDSSDDSSKPPVRFLLGGLVDLRSVKLDNPSWGKPLHDHGGHLGQLSYSSSSSTSPPTSGSNPGKGQSSFEGGVVPLQAWPERGPDLLQPPPGFENPMSPYQCFRATKLSKGSAKSEPPRKRRRREAEVELPPGWEIVTRVRKSGKSKGQIDKYYINRATNQRCRSLPELYRMLGLNPDGSTPLAS